MSFSFHFTGYDSAIHHHLSRLMLAGGWHRVTLPELATFSDQHLSLNDTVSKFFEYKHYLAVLCHTFCKEVIPTTYCIDESSRSKVLGDIEKNHFDKQGGYKNNHKIRWILKPALLNNGNDIHLYEHIAGLRMHYATNNRLGGPHVIQQYIEPPALLEGKKYTYRMPAILTNYEGVFLYHKGYMNISALEYDIDADLKQKRMHVTNYYLEGQLTGVEQRLTTTLDDFETTQFKMAKIVKKVCQGLSALYPEYFQKKDTPIFEVFGFDFMCDESGRCYLIEINQGPDFPTDRNHPFMPILWDEFWQSVMTEFVLPIANQQNVTHRNFIQVASLADLTPGFFKKRKGQKLLKNLKNLTHTD